MRALIAVAVLSGLAAFSGCGDVRTDYYTKKVYEPGEGWTLDWQDDFEGPSVNTNIWNIDVGGGGWGNGELQYYTDRPENLKISNGILVITARRENYGEMDNQFTSARIQTQNKYSFQYGKIVGRIKMPSGKGMWPAFWMMGEARSKVGWPGCGEIDIAEMKCAEGMGDAVVYGTMHWWYRGHVAAGQTILNPDPTKTEDDPWPLYKDFHYFEVEWDADYVTWRLDGKEFYKLKLLADEQFNPFRKPFYILLNCAVGGQFVKISQPEEVTAKLPQTMEIDWVRIYKKK